MEVNKFNFMLEIDTLKTFSQNILSDLRGDF